MYLNHWFDDHLGLAPPHFVNKFCSYCLTIARRPITGNSDRPAGNEGPPFILGSLKPHTPSVALEGRGYLNVRLARPAIRVDYEGSGQSYCQGDSERERNFAQYAFPHYASNPIGELGPPSSQLLLVDGTIS